MGKVGDPIAVIAGGFVALVALHRLVLEDGREPDGSGAERLDIFQMLHHTFEIAAIVKGF